MRPFDHIRVLDLTHVLAGPFCTYQLGCLGADVIKIEDPKSPDMMRIEGADPALSEQLYGTDFMAQNGSKRGMTLNLDAAEGQSILKELVKTADVLVQNFTGDSFKKKGLGYDDLKAINPKLIYCHMSGFGQTGPKANHPAYDCVIQAFSGLMSTNGPVDHPPTRINPAMVDYGTGAQAAMAISAALFQREQTGKGQFIDVSMTDAAFMLMSTFVTTTLSCGKAPRGWGNFNPDLASYMPYDTADGTIMLGAFTNKQAANLMRVLGHEKRADEIDATPRADIGRTKDADVELIRAAMESDTAENWESKLNAAHVPAARVRRIEETLQEPQIASRNLMQSHDGPGPSRLPVAAFSYQHGGPHLSRRPPKLGEHTQEVLAELNQNYDFVYLKSQGVV